RWTWRVGDYDRIRALVEQVVPGFEDYNRRIERPGGFALPNEPRQGRFTTSSGRARFTVHPLPPPLTTDPDALLMTTIRSHDQFNTTIYGLEDRYRGIGGERRVVPMHAQDPPDRRLRPRQGGALARPLPGSQPRPPPAGGSAGPPAASLPSPTPSRAAAAPPTTPRPTSWCPWGPLQSGATPRPPSRWW